MQKEIQNRNLCKYNNFQNSLLKETFSIIALKMSFIPQNFGPEKCFLHLYKNPVNVGMRPDEQFYNIFMYLYNRNMLKLFEADQNLSFFI